jgi:hypothetical protein
MSEENTNVEGTPVNSAEKQTFSLDDIKRLSMEDESVKNWLQSEKDRNFTKGLETWKEKTLPQLLEEEIKKRYPEETEEQRELRELKSQIEQIKKEKERESLRAKAKDFAIENKLPSSLVDFFIGSDDETTTNNLQTLEKVWNEALKTAVGETFKANGREPHKGTQPMNNIVNPWKKETFNLTKQAQILKENPELAKTLQSQAK